MRLGMIGLGRMGGNMARRLRRNDIEVVGYNQDMSATAELAQTNTTRAASNRCIQSFAITSSANRSAACTFCSTVMVSGS